MSARCWDNAWSWRKCPWSLLYPEMLPSVIPRPWMYNPMWNLMWNLHLTCTKYGLLGLDDMHFANLMIQTPNSMSRNLTIGVRKMRQSVPQIYQIRHRMLVHWYPVTFSLKPDIRGFCHLYTQLFVYSIRFWPCVFWGYDSMRKIRCHDPISCPANNWRTRHIHERSRSLSAMP